VNSSECDHHAKTDFRLGEQGKLDRSQLCHTGNRFKVGLHSTARLNKMKTDKYNDPIKRKIVDGNIKMEFLD
jgi:hypothetical protein